jgi:hypothetical protein
VLLLAGGAAFAHHSAPAFYEVGERITVSGTVTEFRFENPHQASAKPRKITIPRSKPTCR